MKRFLLFSIMFLVCGALKAQISVTEFKSLPNDLSARTTADEKPVVDMNGDRCALVKIKTKGIAKEQRDELKFTAGTMATYIAKTEYQDSDIRLWVNPRKGTIVIYHDLFGELKYTFPEELKPQSTYSMSLELNVAGGYLYVKTNPEVGAEVFVDGTLYGKTPYLSEKIAVGEHRIQVLKNDYVLLTKIYEIEENATVTVEASSIVSDFGELIVYVADNEASIYVDNEFKGKGYWKGMILPGNYLVEVKKEGCKTEARFVNVTKDSNNPIKMDIPKEVHGSLEVITYPSGATIRIDGQKYGTTPKTIDNLTVGKHEVKIEKEDYRPIVKEVKIEEKKLNSMEEHLYGERNLCVKSDKQGATILINGEEVGKSPVVVKKEVGETYLVQAKYNDKTKSKKISINETGNQKTVRVLFDRRFMIKPEVGIGYSNMKTNDDIITTVGDDYECNVGNRFNGMRYDISLSLNYVAYSGDVRYYFGPKIYGLFMKYNEEYFKGNDGTFLLFGLNVGASLMNDILGNNINPYVEISASSNLKQYHINDFSIMAGVAINNFNFGISYNYSTSYMYYYQRVYFSKRYYKAYAHSIMLKVGYNINMGWR